MNQRTHNPFVRFPKTALILSALCFLPLLMRLDDFRVSPESRAILEGDQRSFSSYEKVRKLLAGVEVIVVSMECDEVFSPECIDAIRRVSEALQAQPGVVDVKSLTHSTKPVRRGLAFQMEPLVPTGRISAEALAELKEFSLQHPLIRDVMVAADSRHTLITVTFGGDLSNPESQRQLRDSIEAALAPFQQNGLHFDVLGLPLAEQEIRAALRKDLSVFLPIAAAFLVGILGLMLQSLRLLLWALAIQIAAMLAVIGAVAWSGVTVNVFTASLFPLLAGVHLTFLAHMLAAFQRAQLHSQDDVSAIAAALDEVFKSSLFAAITTTVGLLSMQFSEVRQIREFGLLGAIGTVLIFAITFGPGIAALRMIHRTRRDRPDERRMNWLPARSSSDASSARRLRRIAVRFRPAIVAAAIAALVGAAIGISQLRTDIRAAEFLDRTSPTRQALESLDRIYGGINVVQLEIDSGRPGGVNDLGFLAYVEAVQRYANAHSEVSAAYSYAQLMAMINQIWEGNRPDALKLPENPFVINLFVFALKAGNFPFLAALADPEFRKAYVIIRTRDMPADQYLGVIDDVIRFADATRPPSVSVSAAEGIHSILEADRRILRSQVRSAGSTVAIIALVLALLWGSPRLALYSIAANLIPIAVVLGIAGFLSIPLNSVTATIAAIAFAISVDDSIHLVTQWLRARREGCTAGDALERALISKRRPILFTSAILIAMFLVFWLSSFPPVRHFGLLSALAFALALPAVLLLLPAQLAREPRRRDVRSH